jgi:hypothetical protein
MGLKPIAMGDNFSIFFSPGEKDAQHQVGHLYGRFELMNSG